MESDAQSTGEFEAEEADPQEPPIPPRCRGMHCTFKYARDTVTAAQLPAATIPVSSPSRDVGSYGKNGSTN